MLTPEHKAARLGRITSSNAAACLGRSDKHSPLAGWCFVRGEPYIPLAQQLTGLEVDGATDMPEPTEDNRFTRRGHDFEPLVLGWAAEILHCDLEPAPYVAHDNGWSGDSTDALLTDQVTGEVYCAEAKTVSPREAEKWGREMTAEIPRDYRVQAHWHMLHHTASRCYVPFLGGYDFAYRLYVVDRDAEYEGELLQDAEKFHRDYIVTGRPPPVTAKDTDYLKRKYPVGERGNPLEPTPEITDAVQAALKWRERLDMAEAHYHAALNVVRDIMGAHDEVAHELYKISYRNNKESEVVDWPALAGHLGATEALKRQFTRRTPGPRVLRLTGRGEWKKEKASK